MNAGGPVRRPAWTKSGSTPQDPTTYEPTEEAKIAARQPNVTALPGVLFLRVRPESSVRAVDGVFTVRVLMCPTADTFKAGHRLRVQVSGSAHPRFARNLGTDEPPAIATTLRASRHEILDDRDHASTVDLPVTTT